MGIWNWLDWVMGLIYGGAPWGWATLAGTGRWHCFKGMRYGGAQQDRGDGIDLWWHTMMVQHWLDLGDGIDLWGAPWGCATGSGDRIDLWGCTTLARSGRGDWFMWMRHGGAQHWLDRGDGIDSWGCVEWQSTIWLLNLNDDAMCPHVWRWYKCVECVWLRGW